MKRPVLPFRIPWLLAAALMAAASGGCASVGGSGPASARDGFDVALLPEVEDVSPAAIRLRIAERSIVASRSGENLLRVRFSFLGYEDFPGEGDRHTVTGTVFFPVDGDARARPSPGGVLITEFPPGASTSGLAIFPEYGERPAVELGMPAAVVDLRGPVVRKLRDYVNPASETGDGFTAEEPFAYTMLAAYQTSGNPDDLWEMRLANAWIRAMQAVDTIVAEETAVAGNRFLLAGESWASLGAVQAAAAEPRVDGVILCGWPMDWTDHHFTRWRRWERRANFYPLDELQPMPWETSRDVLSFLFSTYGRPDPGCPACEGSGLGWRRQVDYLELLKDGRLEGLATFVIVGDSDPRFALDLETRVSTRPEDLLTSPRRIAPGAEIPWGARGTFGPFSGADVSLPFRDLCYLRGAPSTLAHPQAVEATLAWAQHLAGYRDLPSVRVAEAVEGGDVRIEVSVREGNAKVTGVEIWATEIEGRRDSDFKWALHLDRPEEMLWYRIDAAFAGPGENFATRWRGYFPYEVTRNRAYYVVVRDRAGNLESSHSLPVRPFWNLGDPAIGPARF